MARRKDHTREELKAMILDCACDMVAQGGMEKISTRKISDIIGYTPGTIYNVFDSMEDLYLHINLRTLERLYDSLADHVAVCKEDDLASTLKVLAAAYIAFADQYRPFWMMLFSQQIMKEGIEKTPDWYQDKVGSLFEPLEAVLRLHHPAQDAQERRIAARGLWASIHGVCYLDHTGRIAAFPDAENNAMVLADYLIDIFVKGFDDS